VIETCSGMRSIDTLSMAAVVYTQAFDTPWRRGLVLVLAAFPLAVFLNLIRVLTIILNPYSETIAVHSFQGIVVIVVGVLLIAMIDRLLTPVLPGHADLGPPLPPFYTMRPGRWATLAAILIGIAVGVTLIPPWMPSPKPPDPLFIRLPNRVGEWSAQILKLDTEFQGALYFNESTYRLYRNGDSEVVVFATEDDRLHPLLTLISPKTAYPGPGWEMDSSERSPLDALRVDATVHVMRSIRGRRLVYHWYQGRSPLWIEALRQALALDRGPLRRTDSLLAVRMETPINVGGREAAERVLAEFIKEMAQTPLYADAS
jgi:EpsI family protein